MDTQGWEMIRIERHDVEDTKINSKSFFKKKKTERGTSQMAQQGRHMVLIQQAKWPELCPQNHLKVREKISKCHPVTSTEPPHHTH